ncbi:MAG: WYL domain-containing protein [Oscillospiraceae bacterium]|nr:WYL domain-containing protein [Oscillospiraceae bacterium]
MEKDNKKRLMLMQEVLEKYSDEEHPITTAQIMDILDREYSMKIHRTTVGKDIAELIEMDVDVHCVRSTQNRYFIGSRYFELPELKLLVDAVASSKFITEKKSAELISKLDKFASVYQRECIKRNILTESRIKPHNERSFYIVDSINEAINKNRKVQFTYFEYDANKQKVLRNEGKPYLFSPYSLVWNGDYYYVVGYSHKHEKIGTFRVDRIDSTPEIMEETAQPMPDGFSVSEFTKTVFQMYDQERATVELVCTNEMMKVIIDRFGEDVHTEIVDDEHFKAVVEVSLSPNFFGWLFGFGDKIKLIAPQWVMEKYREMLEKELYIL